MRTQARRRYAAPSGPLHPLLWKGHLPGAAVVLGVAGMIALFFYGVYAIGHFPMPVGWDTPRYLDQTSLVATRGLAGVPTSLPFPSSTLASRAGFPVVVLSMAGALHTSAFVTAATVPVSAAVAIALAAGAFVSWSLRGDRWTFGVAAIVVGVSASVVRLYLPETYTDSLLAVAMVSAALLPALSHVRDGRALVAATLLLGTAGIAHGPFFLLTIGVLGLVALSFLPASWRSWRVEGSPARATPTGRLATLVASAVAVPAVAILALLRAAPNTPHQIRSEYVTKFREDISLYWFPLTVPLAFVGAAGAARWSRMTGRHFREGDADTTPSGPPFAARFLIRLSIAWALVTAAGIVAFVAGANLPAHRLLAFFLPLPILVAIGLLTLVAEAERRAARRSRPNPRRIGIRVALAGLIVLSTIGGYDLYVAIVHHRGAEWLTVTKVQNSATANAYLNAADVRPTMPVVFVFDKANPRSNLPEMTYIMRSVLSPERMQSVHVYLGTPENYAAGRPTYRPGDPTYDFTEGEYWPEVARVLPQHPVALLLASFNPAYARIAASHPNWVVGPDVIALGGGKLGVTVGAASFPSGPRGLAAGLVYGIGTLVLLGLVGVGWAFALLPEGTRGFEALALAPSFGIGVIILSGVLLDTVAGVRLKGGAGAAAVLAPLLLGMLLAVHRLRRHGAETFPAT